MFAGGWCFDGTGQEAAICWPGHPRPATVVAVIVVADDGRGRWTASRGTEPVGGLSVLVGPDRRWFLLLDHGAGDAYGALVDDALRVLGQERLYVEIDEAESAGTPLSGAHRPVCRLEAPGGAKRCSHRLGGAWGCRSLAGVGRRAAPGRGRRSGPKPGRTPPTTRRRLRGAQRPPPDLRFSSQTIDDHGAAVSVPAARRATTVLSSLIVYITIPGWSIDLPDRRALYATGSRTPQPDYFGFPYHQSLNPWMTHPIAQPAIRNGAATRTLVISLGERPSHGGGGSSEVFRSTSSLILGDLQVTGLGNIVVLVRGFVRRCVLDPSAAA